MDIVQNWSYLCLSKNSSYLAGIGQQIDRPWGDKEWVRVVIERLMNYEALNVPIVRHWMAEYKLGFTLYRVRLNLCVCRKQLALSELLRNSSVGQFMGVVNSIEIDSRTCSYKKTAVERIGEKEWLVDLNAVNGTIFSVLGQFPDSPEFKQHPDVVDVDFLKCGKLLQIKK